MINLKNNSVVVPFNNSSDDRKKGILYVDDVRLAAIRNLETVSEYCSGKHMKLEFDYDICDPTAGIGIRFSMYGLWNDMITCAINNRFWLIGDIILAHHHCCDNRTDNVVCESSMIEEEWKDLIRELLYGIVATKIIGGGSTHNHVVSTL